MQAPKFEEAPGQRAEIRLHGPTLSEPLGGAGVRLCTQCRIRMRSASRSAPCAARCNIENSRAADVDFPLGLPLRAGEQTVVPIDLSISFSDLPGLANVLRRAANRQPLAYHLEGTIGVDAGQLGQPVFGPMTLLRGEMRGIQ